MGPWLTASLHLGRQVRRAVRAAVMVSLVFHACLGVVLLRRQARAPAPPADIAAIIRQALPEGLSLAYQPQEFLALNERRTSKNKFAPYHVQETRVHSSRTDDCRPPDAGLPLDND